jgi:hypothetical protein
MWKYDRMINNVGKDAEILCNISKSKHDLNLIILYVEPLYIVLYKIQ